MPKVNSQEEYWAIIDRKIIPIVSLIQSTDDIKRKLYNANELKEKYSQRKEAYETLLNLSNNKKEVKFIKKYLEITSKDLSECINNVNALEEKLNNSKKDLDLSFKDMDSFVDFSYKDFMYLWENKKKKWPYARPEANAIVLLALNHGISKEESEKIKWKLFNIFNNLDIPFLMFTGKYTDLREEFITNWLCSESYLY